MRTVNPARVEHIRLHPTTPNTTYDAYTGALPSQWTLYLYNSAATAAGHDGSTGLLASYRFIASYSGNNLSSLQVTQLS